MTQRQSQVNLLTINKFAQICRTTPRTIRFYEQSGLFKPFKVDKFNKYRYYKAEQARDIFRIKLLQNFHLPLQQIKNLKRKDNLDSPLKDQLDNLEEEIRQKQLELNFLKEIESFLFKENNLLKILKIKEFGPYTLLGKFVKNARYDQINSHIKDLYKLAKDLGIEYSKFEIVSYLDQGYKPLSTKLEICIGIKDSSKKFYLPDGYFIKKHPKTKCWYYDYIGPYEYLTFIHKKLQDYLYDRDLIKGFVFDLHLKGSLSGHSQFEYQTILGFPQKDN